MNEKLGRIKKGKAYDMLWVEPQSNQYMDRIADNVNEYFDKLWDFENYQSLTKAVSKRKKLTDSELKDSYEKLVQGGYIKTQSFEDYLASERTKDLEYDNLSSHLNEEYRKYEETANRVISFLEAMKNHYISIVESTLNARALGFPFSYSKGVEDEKLIDLERTKLRYTISQIDRYIKQIEFDKKNKIEFVNLFDFEPINVEPTSIHITNNISGNSNEISNESENLDDTYSENTGKYEYKINTKETIKNYIDSGNGINSNGWYFDPSVGDYVEDYDPLKDPAFQVFDEYEIVNTLNGTETMKKYADSGHGKNSLGWYFDPSIGEYVEDYDPLKDPSFQVFESEKVYRGTKKASEIDKSILNALSPVGEVLPHSTGNSQDHEENGHSQDREETQDHDDDEHSQDNEETQDRDDNEHSQDNEETQDHEDNEHSQDNEEDEQEEIEDKLPRVRIRHINRHLFSKLAKVGLVLVGVSAMVATTCLGWSFGAALATGLGYSVAIAGASSTVGFLTGGIGLLGGATIFNGALNLSREISEKNKSAENVKRLEAKEINRYVGKMTKDILKEIKRNASDLEELDYIVKKCNNRIVKLEEKKLKNESGRQTYVKKLENRAIDNSINRLKEIANNVKEYISRVTAINNSTPVTSVTNTADEEIQNVSQRTEGTRIPEVRPVTDEDSQNYEEVEEDTNQRRRHV